MVQATPEVINHWFEQCLKPTPVELGLHDKPQWMWISRPAHVVCKRGVKSLRAIIGVLKGKTSWCKYVSVGSSICYINIHYHVPYGSLMSFTKRMDDNISIYWLVQEYLHSFTSWGMTSAAGVGCHSSRISFEVHALPIENRVDMQKFTPHLTHLLQLVDVGGFKPMKANWYSAVAKFTRRGVINHAFSAVWKKYNPQEASFLLSINECIHT